jgi:hypothetical protein
MIVSMGVVVPEWREDSAAAAPREVADALARHKASS